ncbi:MAG: ferrochelatase [Kordiimonas sp.]|nr:ferrochelatase [Kordiimonas sp.]|tara:strand:- start:8010 stop:9068 length:1059 start_codon:yes stop_codon:yes gene_type:complete
MKAEARGRMTKTAVILFNLGGPDSPEAVEGFLYNLFKDPAIISVPNPLRWFLAKMISKRRAPLAREIYEHIGGSSPLLQQTIAQGHDLQKELSNPDDGKTLGDVKCFVAMRYWHPFADDVAREVKNWGADKVILLPLYPQFSTTTTGSSVKDWHRVARKKGLSVSTKLVCCYPDHRNFIKSHLTLLQEALATVPEGADVRILFSAHGLPKKVIDKGDPYQQQVEATVKAIVSQLDEGIDHVVCYQSKVGPLEWIGPSTEDEICRAGRENKAVVIVPVAFVSEHSETLVELDIEYKELAEENGVKTYIRVPALGTEKHYIEGLADLVRKRFHNTNERSFFCDPQTKCCLAERS